MSRFHLYQVQRFTNDMVDIYFGSLRYLFTREITYPTYDFPRPLRLIRDFLQGRGNLIGNTSP